MPPDYSRCLKRRPEIRDQGVAKQNTCAIVSQRFGGLFISSVSVRSQITCSLKNSRFGTLSAMYFRSRLPELFQGIYS